MNILFTYDIFPHWLGINNFGTLIGAIMCFILVLFLYILLGGAICPKRIENRFLRIILILLWPICIILAFISLPIIALVDFSKPWKQQEKELNDIINDISSKDDM